MTTNGLLQIGLYLVVLLLLVKPLGWYMARVYEGEPIGLDRVLRPVERFLYRLSGVRQDEEMDWKGYAIAFLLFSAVDFIFLYALLRLQQFLPLNPRGFGPMSPDLAFNTAISFVTNTNWQNYGGETTLELSVPDDRADGQELCLGGGGHGGPGRVHSRPVAPLGQDPRQLLGRPDARHALHPDAAVRDRGARPGVPGRGADDVGLSNGDAGPADDLRPAQAGRQRQPDARCERQPDHGDRAGDASGVAVGPAASQIAIKQLGTNGGGFFNVNSAHPFENSTPLSNFVEVLSILLIPAALCYTFGKMVGDTRQGWAVLAAMTVILVAFLALAVGAEQSGNARLAQLGVDQTASNLQPGGNMEGKEVRFGIANSALWATATTAASNGSVNSMHDSYTPLGGLVPLVMMQFGEVIFGGVGSGLYGMLVFAIIAVFIAGLMVGRTPEYLGKKIESYEMKMASLIILVMPLVVLCLTALAAVTDVGKASISSANPGPHGFSEILYAYTSQGNNNGSAFAGLNANTPFYNLTGALAMFFGRFFLAVPTLALAGSLGRKKIVPASAGTLPTHTPLFVVLLISVVIIVAALTFIPADALGPIVEHLIMVGH